MITVVIIYVICYYYIHVILYCIIIKTFWS